MANYSPGADLIGKERVRQIEEEGHTIPQDAELEPETLTKAAIAYCIAYFQRTSTSDKKATPYVWPFKSATFKPTPNNRVNELAKAGALIAAEIDRILMGEAVLEAETQPVEEPVWDFESSSGEPSE